MPNHLPLALTVLLKATVLPPPHSLMPLRMEPLTVSVFPENTMSLPTALISPKFAPAVAAKVMGASIVTPPEPRLSSFACVPPKS